MFIWKVLISAHPAHKLLDRVHSAVRGVGFQFEVSARESSFEKQNLNELIESFRLKFQHRMIDIFVET